MVYNSRLKRKAPLKRSVQPIKRTPLKTTQKPIRRVSSEQAIINKELSALKKEIEIEALQDGTYYCQGCGGARCNNTGLDKCHILPIGRYPHLQLIKEIMILMGRKCHVIWDSGSPEEKEELLCYDYMMAIVKKYDELWYNRLLNKLV